MSLGWDQEVSSLLSHDGKEPYNVVTFYTGGTAIKRRRPERVNAPAGISHCPIVHSVVRLSLTVITDGYIKFYRTFVAQFLSPTTVKVKS